MKITKKAVNTPFVKKNVLPYYHFAWSFYGRVKYKNPSNDIAVVGITGTKGKSSVVYLLSEILEETGNKTAAISSIETKIGEDRKPNLLKMTMPGRGLLQGFLAKAVKEKCKYALIEATSQGILQSRHKFINFDTGIFTNLQKEHIEAHGSFENYRKEKTMLFKEISESPKKTNKQTGDKVKKRFIINIDDPNFQKFSGFSADEKIAVSLNEESIEKLDFTKVLIPKNLSYDNKIVFDLEGERFFSDLKGKFNVYNILAAIAFCWAEGGDIKKISEAVSKIKHIPGRMEFIDVGQNFKAIIDYAHTPDSLDAFYKAVKKIVDGGRMLCLFGSAGGDRDKWKRSEMAGIAQNYCDVVCISNEDPYDESPEKILDDLERGFSEDFKKNPKKFYRILDRKKGMKKITSLAKKGDAVVFTGKGSERWIEQKEGRLIWDEKKEAEEAIKNVLKIKI